MNENETAPAEELSKSKQSGEPSLGPACLVVAILGLAVGSAACGLGSWFVFRDQPALAVKAIEKQLIPWVEGSQLAPADRASIVKQLEKVVDDIQAGAIDKRQLSRLHNCLQDNPVILWGGVQSIESQAKEAGLTELELETLKRTNQRLLRMATERLMGRNDLEYTIQQLSEVSKQGDTLQVNSNLTADQIRSYIKRVESLLVRSKVPNEPFEKTPAEAFAILLEAALTVPKNN